MSTIDLDADATDYIRRATHQDLAAAPRSCFYAEQVENGEAGEFERMTDDELRAFIAGQDKILASASMPTRQGGMLARRALDLATRPLLAQDDGAGFVVTNDVERVLAGVDTDDSDDRTSCAPGYGRALLLAASVQCDPLAGREHGRTIPAEVATGFVWEGRSPSSVESGARRRRAPVRPSKKLELRALGLRVTVLHLRRHAFPPDGGREQSRKRAPA